MTSVEIYINGEMAVYDDQTAIGTIIRNFDFTDPGNRKQPYTNSLKIPVKENQHIFQFASEPGYNGSIPYTKVVVEIFVSGYFLLKDGIGYLTSVSGGYYYITIRDQPDVIQTMKDRMLSDIDLRYGSIVAPWAQNMLNATDGPKLDFIYNEQSRLYSVANPTKFRSYRLTCNLTYYIHRIFTTMGTLDGITFAGSLMSDSYFLNARVICSQLGMHRATGGAVLFGDDIIVSPDKTFFDLFKAVLQTFGAVYTISGSTITIQRYDDITLNKVSWAGKLQKINKKTFSIPNIAQKNYFRLKPAEQAEDTLNEASWVCNNKNIEDSKVIIEPDVHVYPFLNLNGLITGASSGDKSIFIPDSEYDIVTGAGGTVQTTIKAISDFVFVVDGVQTLPTGIDVEFTDIHTTVGGDNMTIATYYNSQNDYLSFEAMIADPVVYDVEVNFDVLDLHNFDVLDLAIVPELAGEFYVNRFQYNFDKGGRSSRAVLIKYVAP
jgi:hypothetical protein